MNKWWFLVVLLVILTSFREVKSLKGTWQYCGGKFNNKPSAAPEGYTQLRKYTDTQFDAFLLEKGEKDVKYESGNYNLKGDTCLETQTYSMQESKLLNVTVHYLYKLQHDTLVLSATLPSGAISEDYWKRVK
jgi:hypothetical protein